MSNCGNECEDEGEDEEEETTPPEFVLDEFDSWQDRLADCIDDNPNHPD